MKVYQEITILPHEEVHLYFLWSKVYQQLHLAFVEIEDSNNKIPVGVSFPAYDELQHELGRKLRLFAPSEQEIEKLKLEKWMTRLRDYIHVTRIKPVPDNIGKYAFFKRLQPKNNNERLARRKAKRHGISFEEALATYENRKEQYCTAPYIYIQSLSSRKRYRLIVAKIDCDHEQAGDGFSTYGLSPTSTVPLF